MRVELLRNKVGSILFVWIVRTFLREKSFEQWNIPVDRHLRPSCRSHHNAAFSHVQLKFYKHD